MAVVKAISTQELAALANRLRLTLIRDRMEEMLTMAVDKKLSPGLPNNVALKPSDLHLFLGFLQKFVAFSSFFIYH